MLFRMGGQGGTDLLLTNLLLTEPRPSGSVRSAYGLSALLTLPDGRGSVKSVLLLFQMFRIYQRLRINFVSASPIKVPVNIASPNVV